MDNMSRKKERGRTWLETRGTPLGPKVPPTMANRSVPSRQSGIPTGLSDPYGPSGRGGARTPLKRGDSEGQKSLQAALLGVDLPDPALPIVSSHLPESSTAS